MDNLTHSLVGALLGQAGLKRLSGRAMATLVLAANLPDVDAVATLLGTESLAIRRGFTHGPIGLLVLPPLLVALVLAWNRWRPADRPVNPRALLLLAYAGALTHPLLDWLNSYGIRLLEPFSSRWSYGDSLFIIDPWVWAVLIAGLGLSLHRQRRGRAERAPAIAALGAVTLFAAANHLVGRHAEQSAWAALRKRGEEPAMVVANPVPLKFWERRMLWRDRDRHGDGHFHLSQGVDLTAGSKPSNLDHPRLARLADRSDVAAFLFWSRMPIVLANGRNVVLTDQRFASSAEVSAAAGGSRLRYNPFTIPLE